MGNDSIKIGRATARGWFARDIQRAVETIRYWPKSMGGLGMEPIASSEKARIAELEAEIDAQQARIHELSNAVAYALRQRDEARTEIARLRAERAWQPISSAPRDARDIVLWHGRANVGGWITWVNGRTGWYINGGYPVEPTHWMPLPPLSERGA